MKAKGINTMQPGMMKCAQVIASGHLVEMVEGFPQFGFFLSPAHATAQNAGANDNEQGDEDEYADSDDDCVL